jgi:hypothetical protein
MSKAIGIAGLFLSQLTQAFNLETHAFISDTAVGKSVLSGQSAESTELFVRLGFDRLTPERPFSQNDAQTCAEVNGGVGGKDHYVDAVGGWHSNPANTTQSNSAMRTRCPFSFERSAMPPPYTGLYLSNLGPNPSLRFAGWFMRGIIREDDFKAGKYDDPNLAPDQDPWTDEFRSVHHFYNPVSNETGLGSLAGVFANATRSTTWALGVADTPTWANDQTPAGLTNNHFSYIDARRLQWLALTYKENTAITAASMLRQSNFRDNLWATSLKALGHVSHLLQDGASPQHVRGEGHSFLCNGNLVDDIPEAPIATRNFENFANYRVTFPWNQTLQANGVDARYSFANLCEDESWRRMFEQGGQSTPASVAQLALSTYPIPSFSVQRKFFTTRLEDSSINNRRGLMDFTNRGFYTEGKFAFGFQSPPENLDDPSLSNGEYTTQFVPGLGNIKVKNLSWDVPDAVAPTFVDPGFPDGKIPIASLEFWQFYEQNNLVPERGLITLSNYVDIQNLLIPRAIAYTTGLINFFFRGKLEIEPIDQRIFGVINQGEPHTVDADGYPIRTSNNKIFGFEKIRLKVRNLTDPIIESGTNQNVPQTVGVGKLVAVARYHRNACYKPDLSGERQQRFATPPALLIDEPVCASGLPTRTNYQEISVSAPLTINSSVDLPGGSGGTPPASIEKIFDFSADPIPVNATDLFIQVVYRGQLGEETDGIAVGNIDVQESTYLAAWNNTDYYFSEVANQWLVQNPLSFPARGVDGVAICAGVPSRLVYRYIPENGPGLGFFLGNLNPGVVRLGFIFAKPATATSQYSFRINPLMLPPPSAQQRLAASRGQQRQASREIFDTANPLPAPSFCRQSPPVAGSTFWCFDPVQVRRGQAFGDIAQAIYYTSGPNGANGPDVDAAPAQAPFPGLRVRDGGVNRFNEDATFTACPLPTGIDAAQVRAIEQREEALSLGVDLGD